MTNERTLKLCTIKTVTVSILKMSPSYAWFLHSWLQTSHTAMPEWKRILCFFKLWFSVTFWPQYSHSNSLRKKKHRDAWIETHKLSLRFEVWRNNIDYMYFYWWPIETHTILLRLLFLFIYLSHHNFSNSQPAAWTVNKLLWVSKSDYDNRLSHSILS